MWEDNYGVVALNIPNSLFGFPGPMGVMTFSEPSAYLTFNSENPPTEADVVYNWTTSDYLDQSSGWFAKAIETLERP